MYVWTKAGPARVITEDKARIKILLPGRKAPTWTSRTNVQPIPKKLILAKKVKWEYECGCTAIAEMVNKKIEHYNVYGSVKKYLSSKERTGSTLSPYHRRKELAEKGFTRSRAKKARPTAENDIYHLLGHGYFIMKTPITKQTVKPNLSIDPEELKAKRANGATTSDLSKEFGVSKVTIRKYLKKIVEAPVVTAPVAIPVPEPASV